MVPIEKHVSVRSIMRRLHLHDSQNLVIAVGDELLVVLVLGHLALAAIYNFQCILVDEDDL